MLSRRRFLCSTALASAGLAAGAGAARAFSIEEGSAGIAAQVHEAKLACQISQAFHAQLLEDARAAIDGRRGLSQEERAQLLAAVTCPICGCPIAS